MDKKECTDFLYSQGSFMIGFGSVANVPGNYYDFNYSSSEEEADRRAVACDWKMIQMDMENAIALCVKHRFTHPISEHEFTTK